LLCKTIVPLDFCEKKSVEFAYLSHGTRGGWERYETPPLQRAICASGWPFLFAWAVGKENTPGGQNHEKENCHRGCRCACRVSHLPGRGPWERGKLTRLRPPHKNECCVTAQGWRGREENRSPRHAGSLAPDYRRERP